MDVEGFLFQGYEGIISLDAGESSLDNCNPAVLGRLLMKADSVGPLICTCE